MKKQVCLSAHRSLRKGYANLNDVFLCMKDQKEDRLSLSDDGSPSQSPCKGPNRHWAYPFNFLSPSDQVEIREVEYTSPGKSTSRKFMCLQLY